MRPQLSTHETTFHTSQPKWTTSYDYDNFDQTIMGLEVSQTEDPLNQAPQPGMHYGASTEEKVTRFCDFSPTGNSQQTANSIKRNNNVLS